MPEAGAGFSASLFSDTEIVGVTSLFVSSKLNSVVLFSVDPKPNPVAVPRLKAGAAEGLSVSIELKLKVADVSFCVLSSSLLEAAKLLDSVDAGASVVFEGNPKPKPAASCSFSGIPCFLSDSPKLNLEGGSAPLGEVAPKLKTGVLLDPKPKPVSTLAAPMPEYSSPGGPKLKLEGMSFFSVAGSSSFLLTLKLGPEPKPVLAAASGVYFFSGWVGELEGISFFSEDPNMKPVVVSLLVAATKLNPVVPKLKPEVVLPFAGSSSFSSTTNDHPAELV